jgi:chloride channel 3/4/5
LGAFRRNSTDDSNRGEAAEGQRGSGDELAPSGPISGPAPLTWRRQRLLDIGHANSDSTLMPSTSNTSPLLPPQVVSESTALQADDGHARRTMSYGTLPSPPREDAPRASAFSRRRKPGVLSLAGSRVHSRNVSLSPTSARSPFARSIREVPSVYFQRERPISAYDAPLMHDLQRAAADDSAKAGGAGPDPGLAASVNGLRVWYASFTSVDWLHDAIKDSIRRGRLRRRGHKSVRGKARLALDRSMGWVIVTIVGFLTALAAFFIVRSEQLLFDFKEGYCTTGWWKAHRFCCHALPGDIVNGHVALWQSAAEDMECPAWRTWASALGPAAKKGGKYIGFEAEMIEYVAYACIAVSVSTFV